MTRKTGKYFFPRNPGKTRFPVILPTPNASIVFRSIRSPMSDWTAVTSKKKSSMAEPEPPSEPAMLPSDTNDTIPTTKLRAEFTIHTGHKNFNPVKALKGLFSAMQQAYPSINMFNVESNYSFKTCLLYTSPSPRDGATSRMPSSA